MAERALPWLLCLPALLFATPLSPLADDPYPHLAGTGWAVLLLVPLALAVLVRGANVRAAWPFLLALLWGLVSWRLAPVTDTFEARRALLVLGVFPLALAGGATLSTGGRATFQGLCVLLSCAWTGWALWSGFADGNFAGLLGDTGSLSQAALGGAAIGAVWAAREAGARRAVGALALGLFLVHVAAAPVLAGSHTLLAGLLLAAWRAPGGRGRLAGLALCALLAPFAGLAAREWATGKPPMSIEGSVEGAPERPAHSLGGLGVRALVWKASLGLIADHPLTGAGPGQFQAAFPVHRDPREIELSRHGVCSELDTEVEHAHNDWLQAFCELGLPGGLLFALGLALATRAALRALPMEESIALAVAALALLVNALVHAPLSGNPASSVLAFAVLGALSGPESGKASSGQRVLLAVPVLLAAPLSLSPIRHGLALGDYADAARAISRLPFVQDPGVGPRMSVLEPLADRAHAAIVRACARAPDAVPARVLAAREAAGSPESWDAVLERRPYMVEAWEQSGTIHARRDRPEQAHARYLRALELSPTHPRILRNWARLELTAGDPELGREAVGRLRAQGCLEQDWLDSLGGELVLERGAPERGALALFGTDLAQLSPEELHAHSLANGPLAETEECLAQLLWARQHAGAGAFDLAVRNYRQARDKSQGSRAAAAPLYVLELAAAEQRAGQRDRAEEHVQGVRNDPRTWSDLPEWAREALGELGLAPGEER